MKSGGEGPDEASEGVGRDEGGERAPSSKSRFSRIIEASPVPYAINDEAQNITYVNPCFVETFGYERRDIPTLADWWPKAYPDPGYRRWVAEVWERRLLRAKETGEAFEPVEVEIRCADGSKRTVIGSTAALGDTYGGEHLVILYDITERVAVERALREQEKKLTEIIDHLPSMVFLKEAKELRYARFNAAGAELLGVPQEELIGKNDYDFFPKEQADFFTDRDRAVLASGEMEDIPDEPIDTPHGTRSLRTRKVAIHGEDGEAKYLLGISEDITEQKRMKAEHDRLQRELQQSHKMESLGHLAGGIAHDFNNLLSIICGFGDEALRRAVELDDEQLIEDGRSILAAGERATKLVAQMLAFSRSQPVDHRPLALADLLREDIPLLRATLPSSMRLETEIEARLPWVSIDPTQFQQLLMNLAVNARDAMDGTGRLTIGLRWARDLDAECAACHKPIRGNWIELYLADTGSGISDGDLANIFTPFFTSKGVGEGTGMGLAVVYGIMEGLGGHILVDTSEAGGSTFRLLFTPAAVQSVRAAPSSLPAPSPHDRGHILVVDDEPGVAKYLRRVIERGGYAVSAFTDPRDALQTFRAAPQDYALLLTDQTMPDITGLELLDEVRGLRPDLPVIVCSGYAEKADDAMTTEKAFRFLEKPTKVAVLLRALADLLA